MVDPNDPMIPLASEAPEKSMAELEDEFSTTVFLVGEIKKGSSDAFKQLYERHYDRVMHSVSLRMGKHLSDCAIDIEGVVQDAFLYAWDAITTGKFDETQTDGSFRNWIANHVVVNKLRDEIRKFMAEKRGGGRIQHFEEMFRESCSGFFVAQRGPGPATIAGLGELNGYFMKALLKLSDRHRTAIDLRYFCDMSFEEVATTMGFTNPGSARSILHRALKELKRHMDPDPPTA